MLTKLMSIVLSIALVGTLTPSWAGDPIAQTQPDAAALARPDSPVAGAQPFTASSGEQALKTLLARKLASRGQFALSTAAMPRLGFADPAQTPSSSQSSGKGGLTKAGKILTVVGVGVAGTGAIMIAKGGQTELGTSGTAVDWRRTGYMWVGIGGVLALIGLTRREK